MISLACTCSAVVGTLLMTALLCILLLRYFVPLFPRVPAPLASFAQEPKAKPAKHVHWKEALLCSLLWFCVSRAVILLATLLYARANGNAYDYLHGLTGYWTKWDAPHYVGLIRNWYVNTGDARFHIVFFPVYPLLCKVLLPMTGENAEAAAYLVSNLAAVASGALLYRLTALRSGRNVCRTAVMLFFCNPFSFFLSLPYTESVFLLLTLASVYCAKKERFPAALLLGAVCAASRLMGVAVAIPIFRAMLLADRGQSPLKAKRTVLRFAQCLTILLGVAAYLFLNWRVTGSPFRFWEYQRDHWYNTSGTLWNSYSYILHYVFTVRDAMLPGTWLPTFAAVYAAPLLLLLRSRKEDAGDLAYGWAYMFMTIIPTWLISGPRYVSGLYTLYPLLGSICRKRGISAATCAVSCLLLALFSCLFVFTGGVY